MRIALADQHDADVFGGLVHRVFEQRRFFRLDQFGQPLHQFRFLHLIGNLGDDDAVLAARELLDFPPGAQAEGAAAPEPIQLSAREWAVLEVLMARPGVVFSRAQLEEKLYSWKDEVSSNAVEVYIHGLRKKLGAACDEVNMDWDLRTA